MVSKYYLGSPVVSKYYLGSPVVSKYYLGSPVVVCLPQEQETGGLKGTFPCPIVQVTCTLLWGLE